MTTILLQVVGYGHLGETPYPPIRKRQAGLKSGWRKLEKIESPRGTGPTLHAAARGRNSGTTGPPFRICEIQRNQRRNQGGTTRHTPCARALAVPCQFRRKSLNLLTNSAGSANFVWCRPGARHSLLQLWARFRHGCRSLRGAFAGRWPEAATSPHALPESLPLLRSHLFPALGPATSESAAIGARAAKSAEQNPAQDQDSERLPEGNLAQAE